LPQASNVLFPFRAKLARDDNEQPASAFLLSIDEFEKSRLRNNAAVAATITISER